MIHNRVPELVNNDPRCLNRKGKPDLYEISRITGIGYNTVQAWVRDGATLERCYFETYLSWCQFFGCDVLEYRAVQS